VRGPPLAWRAGMERPRFLRLPPRLASHPWVAPLKGNLVRARRLRAPARYFGRETLRRRQVGCYAVRGAPAVHVYLEHATPDVETFDQVFVQRAVAPPAPVEAALRRLGRPPTILDLGANVGCASAWFAAHFEGASITCVEPDPRNLSLLRRAAADNAWRVVEAAGAAADGTLRFDADGSSMARARPDGGVEVRAVDVFALAGDIRPDLVKIDVEGGEWELLADPRLAGLAAVALGLEFHTHLAPSDDPRDAAVSALESAGYTVIEVPHVTGAPAGEGSLWAWRPDS
jgi:FkbM family methyltransferase